MLRKALTPQLDLGAGPRWAESGTMPTCTFPFPSPAQCHEGLIVTWAQNVGSWQVPSCSGALNSEAPAVWNLEKQGQDRKVWPMLSPSIFILCCFAVLFGSWEAILSPALFALSITKYLIAINIKQRPEESDYKTFKNIQVPKCFF